MQEIIQCMPTQQKSASVEAKGFLCNLPSPHAPVNRQVSAPAFPLHRTLACFKAWALPGKSLLEFHILQMQLSVTQRPALNFLLFCTLPFLQVQSHPGTDIARLLSTPRLQALWLVSTYRSHKAECWCICAVTYLTYK